MLKKSDLWVLVLVIVSAGLAGQQLRRPAVAKLMNMPRQVPIPAQLSRGGCQNTGWQSDVWLSGLVWHPRGMAVWSLAGGIGRKRAAAGGWECQSGFMPDVSELPPAERFPTGFKLADGRPAEVFSSFQRPTVLRHFQWLQEYGIDGVFVQRFANGLRSRANLEHNNTVLANCRAGANLHGRPMRLCMI